MIMSKIQKQNKKTKQKYIYMIISEIYMIISKI